MIGRYSHLGPGHQRRALEPLVDRQDAQTGQNSRTQVVLLLATRKEALGIESANERSELVAAGGLEPPT